MNKLYLTENLIELDDKLYIEKTKNNRIPIKKHNWHTYLSEYGWSKLCVQWIKKLNKLSEISQKNSLYGSLDCGENGDCLFNCISYALSKDLSFDACQLRNNLSESITYDDYEMIIGYYRIFEVSDDFDEKWDLEEMTYESFKEKIRIGGNDYWADFFMIILLQKFLELNFVILNSNYDKNEHYYYSILNEYDDKKKTVILLYENNIHFRLIGHFQEWTLQKSITKICIWLTKMVINSFANCAMKNLKVNIP